MRKGKKGKAAGEERREKGGVRRKGEKNENEEGSGATSGGG